MRHETRWSSAAIWMVVLLFALVCGLVVIGEAFDTRVVALGEAALRLSADYSSDPRDTNTLPIAPLDSAVIGDTARDLFAEQSRAPLLGMLFPTPASLASQTARPPFARPTLTPLGSLAVGLTATAQELAPTAALDEMAGLDPEGDSGIFGRRPRRAATPTPTRQPTSTPTSRPTSTPTFRPTARPTRTPEPPTFTPEPPTFTPEPPTFTPEPPTFTPEPPTFTPEPPTATPEPPTATPEPPTATPEPPTATPEPPTATPEPPTATPEPPTFTPEPPTFTPEPPISTPVDSPDPLWLLIWG
ncbi:MAG: hypothetical protein IPO81_15665 [Kouleothrix sp.]|nr:hypothetical protein [Kouleothrix sp.]